MIPLLSRIAACEARTLSADDATAQALRLLEWPQVAGQVAAHCLCRRAAARTAGRLPLVDAEAIALRWLLADELRAAGDEGRWPPLLEVSALLDWLEAPRTRPRDGPELVHAAAVAAGLDEVAAFFGRAAGEMPTWAAAASAQARFAGMVAAVRRALDRDGRLLDGASPLLARLRREGLAREREARAAAQRALAAARQRGLTTGEEVVLRGDRYCVPLRAGVRRRLEGIVHDRSASGGTLFVEPAAVVELTNQLVEIRLAAAAEEARILLELNRLLEAAAEDLRQACGLLLLADETRAALLWSRQRRARRPAVAAGATLRLCAARHPLLEAAGAGGGAGGEVVPLDLELPPERRVLLISGPNAGGKSVALKTVGVCVLLAQCGWDVPAREDSRLPLVERLFVDFGDEQSIAMSLSSFSAHLGNLARFLAGSGPSTLVLCDEIGSGTDPQEGTALAYTVLEELAARGALVLASTHFGLLKAAVHEHPAMLNAAMDFDEASLRPRFTLRLGVPGASHAFAIAGRCGLPAELLARARGLVGDQRFELERLLTELGARARSVAELEAEARLRERRQAVRESELAARLEGLEAERRGLLESARQAGEALLQEGRRAVEAAVREIRTRGADAASVRDARHALRGVADRLEAAAPPPARPAPPSLQPGDPIRIPQLGLAGTVLEVRGERVVAEARGMRLTLPAGDVQPLAGPPPAPSAAPDRAGGATGGSGEARREIDLRGERAEEGWRQLDLLIDRAIPAGLSELRVIHGLGTGRLRAYLHERLAADPRVAGWSSAAPEQGGAGVSVVRLPDA